MPNKALLNVALLAALLAVGACSDDDDSGGASSSSSSAGGSSSSSSSSAGAGPASGSWQGDFADSDRYAVIDAPAGFAIDPDTLAIITTETVTGDFDGPFTTPAGESVTPAAYFGAVDPAAADPDDDPSNGGPFWDGWTIRDPDIDGNLPGSPATFHPLRAEIENGTIAPASPANCADIAGGLDGGGTVQIFGVTFPVCVIQDGDLDGEYTLTNDHVYVLDGTVQIGNGDVESASDPSTVVNHSLTIEAGTQIFGAAGTSASLVVTRGSTIQAVGTAEMPIVFGGVQYTPGTGITDDPTDLGGRGVWGSLVLSGYGRVNNGDANDQTTSEAVPDGVTRWFGGTDDADSSGTVRYVILAETGEAFRPDEEVQGLTVEAAGSGTEIEYVQITNSDDDGVEFFGGAASARYLVIQGVTDDSIDIDLGYRGVIQYVLALQGENHGDRGIESDSNGSNFDAEPKTSPVLANLTLLGHYGNGGASDANTLGALHREGFGGQVYRSVYADDSRRGGAYENGCLDVDDELDENLAYGDVLFNCSNGALANDSDE